ncbi:MBL fold metallo-hydrolase [Peribacillus sp. SCS-155]|uniref:MBL fold metallo-hydrolase n=1 Tax=Peribacillus sedimenti TaxID=3115297 RepID=UPI0039060DE4
MLFKKQFEQKSVNGVKMAEGILSFNSITLNVHSFFLDGVLIDTGAKALEGFFKPFFNNLEIQQVAITHYHEDHTGCAAYLQEKFQLPLFMNDIMIGYCQKKADYPIYRQLFWGKRRPFRAEPIEEVFHSRKGTWRAVKTPGHSIDHLAFLNQATGQLFTGDLYCQSRTRVVLREENIPSIIESLKNILTYDFDEVFCSHAGYLNDGRTALKNKLEYLLDLQGNILKLYDEGKNHKEINSLLFPKKYPITFFSSGEWDSIHIVNSIINGRRENSYFSSPVNE